MHQIRPFLKTIFDFFADFFSAIFLFLLYVFYAYHVAKLNTFLICSNKIEKRLKIFESPYDVKLEHFVGLCLIHCRNIQYPFIHDEEFDLTTRAAALKKMKHTIDISCILPSKKHKKNDFISTDVQTNNILLKSQLFKPKHTNKPCDVMLMGAFMSKKVVGNYEILNDRLRAKGYQSYVDQMLINETQFSEFSFPNITVFGFFNGHQLRPFWFCSFFWGTAIEGIRNYSYLTHFDFEYCKFNVFLSATCLISWFFIVMISSYSKKICLSIAILLTFFNLILKFGNFPFYKLFRNDLMFHEKIFDVLFM